MSSDGESDIDWEERPYDDSWAYRHHDLHHQDDDDDDGDALSPPNLHARKAPGRLVQQYMKKTKNVRSGKEQKVMRSLKRAFRKASLKTFVRKENSGDKRTEFWTRKWQIAIKHVLKAVRGVRAVRLLKGGEFTTDTLEPNLLRRRVTQYSYSTWAASYDRSHSHARVDEGSNDMNKLGHAIQKERHHVRNQENLSTGKIGFNFQLQKVPVAYRQLLETPPSRRTPATLELLYDYFKQLDYFNGMPKSLTLKLAKFFHLIEKKAGSYVYKLNDSAEDFFVVLSGTLNIVMNQLGIDFIVAKLFEGGQFGEHDLVESHNRQHDIMAVTDCILLKISRDEYFPIYHGVCEDEMRKKIKLLYSMPIFTKLSQEELRNLAHICEIRRYKEKSVIAKEDHIAQFLFIINDGHCKSIMRITNDQETLAHNPGRARRNLLVNVQELGEGMTFGETVLFDPVVDPLGKKWFPRLKYPASLVSEAYAEVTLIPRTKLLDVLPEETKAVLRSVADESSHLYDKLKVQKTVHSDNRWRRKRAKVLKGLISDTQRALMEKNDSINMGLIVTE
jgi:CRP-like cAMP-binding protein